MPYKACRNDAQCIVTHALFVLLVVNPQVFLTFEINHTHLMLGYLLCYPTLILYQLTHLYIPIVLRPNL